MVEATISEPMTWAQICERYPDQWVALVEIDWVTIVTSISVQLE